MKKTQNKEKPFEWEKMSTHLAHQMSDKHLLANAKELLLIRQSCSGYGLIAEICKRLRAYNDNANIESLAEIDGTQYSDHIRSYIIKHDKKKRCITINYSPTIRDYRGLAKNEQHYDTIFDVRVGEICNFIKEEFRKYSETDETEVSND